MSADKPKPEMIPVERAVLFELMSHLVHASHSIALIDDQITGTAAETALAHVDHVGRVLAELMEMPASVFGSEPPIPVRRGTQPRAQVFRFPAAAPPDRAVDAVAALMMEMKPDGNIADPAEEPTRPNVALKFRPIPVIRDVIPVAPQFPEADEAHAFEERQAPDACFCDLAASDGHHARSCARRGYDERDVITSAPRR